MTENENTKTHFSFLDQIDVLLKSVEEILKDNDDFLKKAVYPFGLGKEWEK